MEGEHKGIVLTSYLELVQMPRYLTGILNGRRVGLIYANLVSGRKAAQQARYRVRAPNARIQPMHAEHQKRSISNETIEPPTINVITRFSGGVRSR